MNNNINKKDTKIVDSREVESIKLDLLEDHQSLLKQHSVIITIPNLETALKLGKALVSMVENRINQINDQVIFDLGFFKIEENQIDEK